MLEPRTEPEPIARYEKLSLAEAHRLIEARIPFIVKNVQNLDYERILEQKNKLIPVYKNNGQMLRSRAESREMIEFTSIGAFLESDEVLYGYDINVHQLLPSLLEDIPYPRYFAHCLLHQTRLNHPWKRAWPTIFLGKATTKSSLHVDQFHTHFWMTIIRGSKRWRIWEEADTGVLNPSWAAGRLDPVFDDEPERPPRWEDSVKEGETLFVPGGTPHQVTNETDSVALAANFIDQTNLDEALEDLTILRDKDPDYGLLHDALDEIEVDAPWSSEEPLEPEHAVVHIRDLPAFSNWRAMEPPFPF